jgi:lysyl-tRNA synthetase class 2
VVRHADGSEHDLGGPWRQVTLHDAVSEVLGAEVTPDTPVEVLRGHAEVHDVELPEGAGAGEVALELFEKLVEHTLIAPTFVRDYPVEVRPLTRQHRDDPRLAEAWDLFIFGVELGTGYSELVDPVVQRERLEAQSRRAAAGDEEAMQVDEDFLRALEYGMPPSGGLGMGIDRLLMTLTGLGIRETILFPLVRPE